MAKRIFVPAGAFEDIRALIRLSAEQLEALVQLFALPDSVSAQRKKFVDTIAETLKIPHHVAQSVVMVCHFVLLAMEETRGRDANVVRDIIDDVREFLAERAPDTERQEL